MGSQVRILSIRLAWEYRFPWISPGREDARAVRPAAPAGGINTSVTTGKKGRRALANAGIQAPSGVQAPDVHSEASHPSFGRRTTRHRRATYPKKHGNADVVQWQHACFPSRRSRVRTPSSALSGENQNNGSNPIMGLVTVFPWDVSGETWTNSLGMGAHRLGRKHASRPGSSEEEQVPFKHWVRIS